MKILGIDPGLATIGFGCIESKNRKYSLIDGGVIKTPAKTSDSSRLKLIYDELKDVIADNQPQVAAVEKLFFAQNVTTGMSVSQARGVILLALEEASVEIWEYTPLQIKSSLTGYGRASKAQIQEMVRSLLNLNKRPTPDDCADALAVALTHAMQL